MKSYTSTPNLIYPFCFFLYNRTSKILFPSWEQGLGCTENIVAVIQKSVSPKRNYYLPSDVQMCRLGTFKFYDTTPKLENGRGLMFEYATKDVAFIVWK